MNDDFISGMLLASVVFLSGIITSAIYFWHKTPDEQTDAEDDVFEAWERQFEV